MTFTTAKLAAATVLAFGMLTTVCHAYCKSVFAPASAYQPASLRTTKPVNLVPARIR
jgi:hypothetical protein